MTVEQWINENYNKILQSAKQSAHNHQDYMDLAHDMIIAFSEHEKAQELVDRGEARWFIVRMMLNQARSNTSPFKRNHRIVHEGYVPDTKPDEEYNQQLDYNIEAVQTAIEEILAEGDRVKKYCMDVVLLTLKQKKPNFSELEREVGIPRTSLSNAYYQGLELIKQKILNNGGIA